jgi:hypothetical protein
MTKVCENALVHGDETPTPQSDAPAEEKRGSGFCSHPDHEARMKQLMEDSARRIQHLPEGYDPFKCR